MSYDYLPSRGIPYKEFLAKLPKIGLKYKKGVGESDSGAYVSRSKEELVYITRSKAGFVMFEIGKGADDGCFDILNEIADRFDISIHGEWDDSFGDLAESIYWSDFSGSGTGLLTKPDDWVDPDLREEDA